MTFNETVDHVGEAIEGVGVAVIAIGVVVSLASYAVAAVRRASTQEDAYGVARRRIGRSILLGLELLVAGDIIRTVVIEPTFTSVGVLAVIVLIRTFLSTTLEMEITGRWPWRRAAVTDESGTS